MAANPQFNQSSLYAALWFAGGGVCVFATSTLMSVAFSETPLAKQAWWFWLLMAAPLILCLILFVFARQYKRQQTAFMQAANKPEDTLSEAKLLALSSAIRPHFFFNAFFFRPH